MTAYKRRVIIIAFLLIFGFGYVTFKLTLIQLRDHSYYLAKALKQQVNKVVIAPRRGDIVDRNGEVLATSTMLSSVYCNPTQVDEEITDELAERLASILYTPQEKINQTLERDDSECLLLCRKIVPEQVMEIESVARDFKLPKYTLFFKKEGKRIYPNSELLSPVLGYVVLDKYGDNRGMAGLEYEYNQYLHGGNPKIITTRGAAQILLDYFPKETMQKSWGATLVLTIDQSIQYIAEKALRECLAREEADIGCVTVMDISTGEILAMASLPSFNPNEYMYYPLDLRRNNAILSPVQPGSVQKIFTFATLLECDLITVDEIVNCGSGRSVNFNGRNIQDAPGHEMGDVPAKLAFHFSSNVGTARLAEKLDNEIFYQHLTQFGFGRKTGIDLPGEGDGILRPVREWSSLSKVSLAIGYEIAVTSIQEVRAVSAIANNGYLMKPYVVEKVVDSEGRVVIQNKPESEGRVVRPAVSAQMLELMEGVVLHGTGTKAQIPGYRVGGKTGTSRKVPYSERKYIASFVGVVPVDAPRLCIHVWVDNPRRHHYGGDVAAPVFKEVAETALKVLRIPPTEPIIEPEPTPIIPLITQLTRTETDDNYEVQRSIEEPTGTRKDEMPDLTGLTMREALAKLSEYNVHPQFVGSGAVVDQLPKAGKKITPGTRCLLIFSNEKEKALQSAQL